jgi:hypothetical protein
LICNSFYRKVYYPMVHSTIRRQFCLFINSLHSLSGFIYIILHYCNASVIGVLANCETQLLTSSYSGSVSLFTWNNSPDFNETSYMRNFRKSLEKVTEIGRSSLSYVTSQKNKDLIYTAAEVRNNDKNSSLIKIWQK